jgi:hypothetical protein
MSSDAEAAAAKKTDAPVASDAAPVEETDEEDVVHPVRIVTVKLPVLGQMQFEVPIFPFEEQVRRRARA